MSQHQDTQHISESLHQIGHDTLVPASDEAEKGVISCILQEPAERLPECRIGLPVDAFYFPANRMVYETMLDMLDHGHPIDFATVTNRLSETNKLEKVGGPGVVSELFTFVPATAHWHFYRKILAEKRDLRRLITTSADIIRAAQTLGSDGESDVPGLVAEAQQKMISLSHEHDGDGFKEWSQIQDEVITDIEAAFDNKGHIPHNKLATGFTSFDRRTGGLEGGQFVVIAGRPAMGKTSIAMNIVECVASGVGHYKEYNHPPAPVLVFSLEMSSKSLGKRMIVGGAGVNLNQVKYGLGKKDNGMERGDQGRILDRMRKLNGIKLYVVEKPAISIQELMSRARVMKARFGIALVVVDYIQLMTSTSAKARTNRQIEVSECSAGLKNLAKELRLPVIGLAQLSRSAEERAGCRPQMSDLRESGSLEQDADIVGLMYRKAYYKPDDADATEAEMIIAKGRDIGVGTVPLEFIGETTSFHSLTSSLLSNDPEKRDENYESKPQPSKKGKGENGQRYKAKNWADGLSGDE